MRYNAVITSPFLKELPEKIKLDDATTATIKEASVIINEFDRSVDPFCVMDIDKGFTVGLKLVVEKRHFEEETDGRCNVTTEKDILGEYVVLTPGATLKDLMNAINDLVDNIQNNVGEPSEA